MLLDHEEVSLRRTLEKFVRWHKEENDPEAPLIPPDPGCVVCTQGVTPDRYNTGLCMFHQAERLIPKLRER